MPTTFAHEATCRLTAESALTVSASSRVSTPDPSSDRLEEPTALRALLKSEPVVRTLPRTHFVLIDRLVAINRPNAGALAKRDIVTYAKTNLEFH